MDTLRPQVDVLVGSIFLNPTQFGENEDLSTYPATESDDLAEFENHGADYVFVPSVEEMYPISGDEVPLIDPGPVGSLLEGARRPGHFAGVATVVARLFSIVMPGKATFGEKDAQQLRIIQHVIDTNNLKIEIVPIPTVRESDGLAISSRNAYLSSDERKAASVLYKSLTAVRGSWESGDRSGEVLRSVMNAVLESEPLADPQYVSIADVDTFEEIETAVDSARALLAVRIGKARLIDNLLLN
jgi:pantoate--beta-alanine ligase